MTLWVGKVHPSNWEASSAAKGKKKFKHLLPRTCETLFWSRSLQIQVGTTGLARKAKDRFCNIHTDHTVFCYDWGQLFQTFKFLLSLTFSFLVLPTELFFTSLNWTGPSAPFPLMVFPKKGNHKEATYNCTGGMPSLVNWLTETIIL